MNLSFLGGAMEIGGSCIYLRIAGKGILMDCGIRQSGTQDPLPDFRTIQQMGGLDAIIISHAHMDHIGTLPIISRAYPHAPIYMTTMTADLVRVLLYDSLKIMNRWEEEIPHYTEKDVVSMLNRILNFGFQTTHEIFENFSLTFYPAGHIAGAACIYLVTEEGSLFYSGDFSAFAQRTIEGIRIPRLRPDVAILETTYGNRLHSNRQTEEKRLIELVADCIREQQKILIPAFALGRAQEVLLILRSAIQNGELPAVKVFVDGMVRDINTMYTRNPIYLKNALGKRILKDNEPFYTKEIQPVAPNQNREELLEGNEPIILVSSSGMLTGGPSVQYAKKLVSMENASIIITGYQDEESPGRQLLNLLENPDERNISLDGVSIPVRCQIHQVGLSAHGDQSEIIALLDRLESRNVFLVHGNRDAIQELGSRLAQEDYRRHIYLPECGQNVEITLYKKRKQLSHSLSCTLQKKQPFTTADEKILWQFWREHYPEKAFPIAQIAQIWYGDTIVLQEEVLQKMQSVFLNSLYFSPDSKRLFLFRANPEEEVAQALQPRELTIQELQKLVEQYFSEFSYRKISFHTDKKEVILTFDYPDSQNHTQFEQLAERFYQESNWTLMMNPSMNHNAAGVLLYTLFGARILKTSYFQEKKSYSITLSLWEKADSERTLQFQQETGWKLLASVPGSDGGFMQVDRIENSSDNSENVSSGPDDDFFLPAENAPAPIEQNLAFSCVEQTFEEEPYMLYKKSIRNDSHGRFLELSFLSPVIGRRLHAQIQTLANQIGWRIRISDKIIQSELFKISLALCRKYAVTVIKNPSWLPLKKELQLTILPDTAEETLEQIQKEFCELTGCECSFVS